MESSPKFNRVLLKLSGEALMGEEMYGIDPSALKFFANEVYQVHKLGVQIGIV
ncbi:MAG: UMP kinase, partial [Candidatus Kapaibacteriota bacterium]